MGYELDRFPSVPAPELLCPVCKQVLEDPIQGKCGHVYCSTCRVKSGPWNYEDTCPVRNEPKEGNSDSDGESNGGLSDAIPPTGRGHGRAIWSGRVDRRGHQILSLPGVVVGVYKMDIGTKCPRGTVSLAFPLKGIIEKQRIKCKFSETCNWIGTIEQVFSHESICKEQIIHAKIEEKYQEIRDLKKQLLELQSPQK